MRIAKVRYVMRRKGHNGISFLIGHFGEEIKTDYETVSKLLSTIASLYSWPANKRTAICRNANNIHLELRPRNSRRVPFKIKIKFDTSPLARFSICLRVTPTESTDFILSLFSVQSNRRSKHLKDSVDSRVILYQRERKLIGFLGRLEKIDDGLD